MSLILIIYQFSTENKTMSYQIRLKCFVLWNTRFIRIHSCVACLADVWRHCRLQVYVGRHHSCPNSIQPAEAYWLLSLHQRWIISNIVHSFRANIRRIYWFLRLDTASRCWRLCVRTRFRFFMQINPLRKNLFANNEG